MRAIKPIRPIRAIGQVVLRRAPSIGQLRLWLWFARQKGKRRTARLPTSNQEPDLQQAAPVNQAEGNAERTDVQTHVDKRV